MVLNNIDIVSVIIAAAIAGIGSGIGVAIGNLLFKMLLEEKLQKILDKKHREEALKRISTITMENKESIIFGGSGNKSGQKVVDNMIGRREDEEKNEKG